MWWSLCEESSPSGSYRGPCAKKPLLVDHVVVHVRRDLLYWILGKSLWESTTPQLEPMVFPERRFLSFGSLFCFLCKSTSLFWNLWWCLSEGSSHIELYCGSYSKLPFPYWILWWSLKAGSSLWKSTVVPFRNYPSPYWNLHVVVHGRRFLSYGTLLQ